MQLTEDEIVCLIDADLTGAFVEIPAFEIRNGCCGPGRHLFVQ